MPATAFGRMHGLGRRRLGWAGLVRSVLVGGRVGGSRLVGGRLVGAAGMCVLVAGGTSLFMTSFGGAAAGRRFVPFVRSIGALPRHGRPLICRRTRGLGHPGN